jgi:hypothetical protein
MLTIRLLTSVSGQTRNQRATIRTPQSNTGTMRIYKFQDVADGNFAFVAAAGEEEAQDAIQGHTSIGVKLIESKSLEDLKRPIILINNILPF